VKKSVARNKLWAKGILSWKLRPEQQKLRSILEAAPTDLAVFNISRRFGKSTTCVTFCVEQAIKRKQHIRYATAYLTDLENFIQPIFEWCLNDCPEELLPKWKASKKVFEFPNGSTIRLVGLDKNPNGLRGNNIDILVVDEAAFVTKLEYLYKSIIVPATMKRKFKLIFPSTPPESPLHYWSAELIPKAKSRNTYVELTIDDISDLTPEEKQRVLDEVGGKDSPTAQREFYCKLIVDATRALAPAFFKGNIAAIDPEYVHYQLFGDTGGVRDKTVFLKKGWCHVLQKVIVRDELVFEPNTPTSTIIAGVKEKFPGLPLTLDASGQLLIDYATAGLPAAFPQKADFAAGLLLLNNAFYNENCIIHPDCKLLIATLEGGLLNASRTDYERSDALGHCDAAAAIIYGLRGIDRITDLRPHSTHNTGLWHRTKTSKHPLSTLIG